MTGFLECTVPYASDRGDVERRFDRLFEQLGKPSGMALLSRVTWNRDGVVFLLTPEAAQYAEAIAPRWQPAAHIFDYVWTFLAGAEDVRDGLQQLTVR